MIFIFIPAAIAALGLGVAALATKAARREEAEKQREEADRREEAEKQREEAGRREEAEKQREEAGRKAPHEIRERGSRLASQSGRTIYNEARFEDRARALERIRKLEDELKEVATLVAVIERGRNR